MDWGAWPISRVTWVRVRRLLEGAPREYIRTMDLGLQGKVVMVTGGAGRLGPVICATFAREGAAVGVPDVAAARATATAARPRESGAQALGVGGDLSRAPGVRAGPLAAT